MFQNWEERTVWRGRSEAEVTPAHMITKLFSIQLTVIVNGIHCVFNASEIFKMMIKWNNEYNEPGIVFLYNRFWINTSYFFCLFNYFLFVCFLVSSSTSIIGSSIQGMALLILLLVLPFLHQLWKHCCLQVSMYSIHSRWVI